MNATTTDLVQLASVSAGYGSVVAVRDLDLRVGEGEVVALLGPNGAGKTTTLLTIAGFLPLISGTMTVAGAPVKAGRGWRLFERGVVLVPEDGGVFKALTVAENLRLSRAPGTRGDADLSLTMELFPALRPLMDRRAGALSGGEQQMLALGRAIACQPRLLMVDEASLGLAPLVVEALLPTLRRFADESGASVLMVEQHVNQALAIADRAYVLAHGSLAATGSAAELRENAHIVESSYLGDKALDSGAI